MGEPYIQQIYTDGSEQQLQPLWTPQGIKIINECDAVIAVTDGRQTWRCSPGRTIARPIVAPGPGGYRAKAEQAATQGSATIIFTQGAITEYVGEDAAIANLFRKTVIDGYANHINSTIVVCNTTVTLGAARYAQLAVSAFIGQIAGTVRIEAYSVTASSAEVGILDLTIPFTNLLAVPFGWRFGPGGDLSMPRKIRVAVTSTAPAGPYLSVVSAVMDVWEGQ